MTICIAAGGHDTVMHVFVVDMQTSSQYSFVSGDACGDTHTCMHCMILSAMLWHLMVLLNTDITTRMAVCTQGYQSLESVSSAYSSISH